MYRTVSTATYQSLSMLNCNTHKDKKIVAVCIKHNDGLCLSCILDNDKAKDCDVKELNECKDEPWQSKLNHIAVKHKIKKLQDSFESTSSQCLNIKEKLLTEVEEKSEQLLHRLSEAKTETIRLIEQQFKIKDDLLKCTIKELNESQADIESNLKKLDDTNDDSDGLAVKLSDINTKLRKLETLPDISGSFKPHKWVEDINKITTLGDVSIIDEQTYDIADLHEYSGEAIQGASGGLVKDTKQHSDASTETNQAPPVPERIRTKTKPLPETQPGTINAETELSPFVASDKEPLINDREYLTQSSLSQNAGQQLIDLRNKTIRVPDIEAASVDSTFSQIIHLGGNCIGLLCLQNSTVIVTELPNGPTLQHKLPGTVLGIVATGSRQLAALVNEASKVNVYRLKSKSGKQKLECSTLAKVPKGIDNITGFDFDVRTSVYVISSQSAISFLDKKGKMTKSLSVQNTGDSTNIKSNYDFRSDQLVYLNVENKTLKALRCKENEVELVWKKKGSSAEFTPRGMCLDKTRICVASGNCIATFSLLDGNPVENIVISDVLGDCLAICVADDVYIWTSYSQETEVANCIGIVKI